MFRAIAWDFIDARDILTKTLAARGMFFPEPANIRESIRCLGRVLASHPLAREAAWFSIIAETTWREFVRVAVKMQHVDFFVMDFPYLLNN
jgi:hypothetical protein